MEDWVMANEQLAIPHSRFNTVCRKTKLCSKARDQPGL